ncbi:response regulator transcription factor [Flavobacterium psychrotolerans]|uniref:DNA-binding response regulator n=1 Tax=Flavobacterium psychrotolerans TaxID=2169410 RepID=A0A2U1JGX5_9FLAO|nr:response regulator transcription factor [Flavobacterium psychrotolerans]PWA04382.1 hypothetical protein DB895_11560 [Flavobacterium psychrotolerans]
MEIQKTIQLLIVDDHQMICDGIKVMLETVKSPYKFIIQDANTSEIAIDMVKNNPFDFILMDYRLSKNTTGADCIKQILSFKPNSKILALSSYDEYLFFKNMIDAGALGYVMKSIPPEELILAIKTILNGELYFSNEVAMSFLKFDSKNKQTNKTSLKLSKKELKILGLIADENTDVEIAKKLGLTTTTVNEYRQSLLTKFGVKNTAELIGKALFLNFI